MPTEIRTRFTGMAYVATVRGEKHTASNTIGERPVEEMRRQWRRRGEWQRGAG